MQIAFYVTGHGLGHAARSADVIAGLLAVEESWVFHLISDLPLSVMQRKFPENERLRFHRRFVDGGLEQQDALRTDVEASRRALEATLERWEETRRFEEGWLRAHGIDQVLVDVPGIPLDAAKSLGIPTVALANFGWDFIYRDFAAEHPIWEQGAGYYERAYAACDLLLQYPWSAPMTSFPCREPIGLVAPEGRDRRSLLNMRLGVSPSIRLVLLGLTSLSPLPKGFETIRNLEGSLVFTAAPFDLTAFGIPSVFWEFEFRDLVASVDVVITKPGFGMFSECARNDKPMLVLEREGFAETPYLTEGLGRNLRGIPIRSSDLHAATLSGLLGEVAALAPAPDPLPADGVAQIHAALRARVPG